MQKKKRKAERVNSYKVVEGVVMCYFLDRSIDMTKGACLLYSHIHYKDWRTQHSEMQGECKSSYEENYW